MFWHNTKVGDQNFLFKKIFKEYYPSLLHFASRLLSNAHDAEDVVQDVFMNMWRNRPAFQNEIALKAYLYLAVRNRCLDLLKKKSPVYTDISIFGEMEQEVELVVIEETLRLLDEAIERLPEKTREVIRLSLENYSVKEVAEKLNITVNTVKTHKLRAYKFLKENCSSPVLLLFLSLLPYGLASEAFTSSFPLTANTHNAAYIPIQPSSAEPSGLQTGLSTPAHSALDC